MSVGAVVRGQHFFHCRDIRSIRRDSISGLGQPWLISAHVTKLVLDAYQVDFINALILTVSSMQ